MSTTCCSEKLAVVAAGRQRRASTADREALQRWMANGGVLVRFAGPRLANAPDDPLSPVRLRAGERALGGAISWGEPAKLAEFADQSPFAGLAVPPDVQISQQVLAEPDAELSERTWARLSDGTPLVTARARGEGWLVLFHTSANTDWSNLPLSGLFVDMLQRLVALSRGVAGGKFDQALRPYRVLDGFGRLADPPVGVRAITPEQAARFTPGPTTPPGLYGEEGAQQAFNLGDRVGNLSALTGIAGGAVLRPDRGAKRDRPGAVRAGGGDDPAAGRHLHRPVAARPAAGGNAAAPRAGRHARRRCCWAGSLAWRRPMPMLRRATDPTRSICARRWKRGWPISSPATTTSTRSPAPA